MTQAVIVPESVICGADVQDAWLVQYLLCDGVNKGNINPEFHLAAQKAPYS